MSTIDCTQLLEIDAVDWADAVAFTADGKHLVGLDADNTVGVWRVKDGEQVATMETKELVWSVAVSKDGRFIAAAGLWQGGVCVWDATTYQQVFVGEGTGNHSFDVDFSPDSTRLVSASENDTAIVWDIAARKSVRRLRHSGRLVQAAKYSPQGDRIATATEESVLVWDSNNGRLLVDIKVPVSERGILWFSNYIFVAAKDNTIKRIDAATGSTISWRASAETSLEPRIALPQHGKFIAHSTSNTLTFWDTETQTQLGPVQHIDNLRSHACSPDGQLLAIGFRKNIIVSRVIFDPSLHPCDLSFKAPDLDIDGAVLNAWKQGLLTDAEALLTAAIRISEDTSHHVLASRALVRVHLGQCDTALVDAEKSIEIHRSLVGYVAKYLALVCMGEKDKGIRVCDIAFHHFQDHASLLLLIKAVVLFIAGEHVDAMSRVNDLITDSAHTSAYPALYVVQAHMRLLHGKKLMESSDHESAIQSFEDARVGLSNHTGQPPLIVSLISGWKFDDLAITIQQRLCEALFAADRTTEAAVSVLRMADPEVNMSEYIKTWVSEFKYRCRSKLENFGDTAVNAGQYDEAVSQYTAALSLDPASMHGLLVKRSGAFALVGMWKDALNDADEMIKLDPSLPSGYERKYQALHGAGQASDAMAAFEMMLLKISESPDPEIREQSRRYIRPEVTQETIRSTIKNVVCNSPPVLINANSGRLCNKSEQIAAFESTPSFTELVCSMTTQIDHAQIEQVVEKYYRYAMFSHTWEGDEPLYEKVVKIVVYNLEASPTHTKLQMFCKVAQDEGFHWAWSDTCCINKVDHFVLQEALVRMFKWYEGSAMTIIFLFDVDELAELGALMMSRWNSRAWTLQEYHASNVVRIYTKNWKPYLGLTIYNHKESPEIISEMERATGISSRALMALRPGLNDIREKLRLASTRQTTRVEDAAYSLLGIFSMTFPATYGEEDKALGRLLSQLLTSSGDASILAWIGKPGSFNSCLPTNISVFSQPLSSHVPPTATDTEMETITGGLRSSSLDVTLATRLYHRVGKLPTPSFAGQRMRLPCLAFMIRIVSRSRHGSEYVYGAQASAIGTVEIRTEQNLMRLGSLYLVHPWIGFLLDRHAAGNVVEMAAEEEDELGDFSLDTSLDPSSTLHAESSSLTALDRVYEFLARLEQPFGTLLLASNPRNTAEFRRVAAESLITVRVKEVTSAATLNGLIGSVRVLDVL